MKKYIRYLAIIRGLAIDKLVFSSPNRQVRTKLVTTLCRCLHDRTSTCLRVRASRV